MRIAALTFLLSGLWLSLTADHAGAQSIVTGRRDFVISNGGTVILGPGVASSTSVQGSGVSAELRYIIASSLVALIVSGPFRVIYDPALNGQLQLQGDDNILPHVRISANENQLQISLASGSYSLSKPIDVRFGGAIPSTLVGSGVAALEIAGLQVDKLNISLSGASSAFLSGKAQTMISNVSGSSQIDGEELRIAELVANVSGSSSLSAFATQSAMGMASGSSRILVHGQPNIRQISATGASRVSYKP